MICPVCKNTIVSSRGIRGSEGTDIHGDPLPFWTDDPILTPLGLSGVEYIGCSAIKSIHIVELQTYYGELEQELNVSDRTEWLTGIPIEHAHIEQLRISVEKCLYMLDKTLLDFFSFDRLGNETGETQYEWTDVNRNNDFNFPFLPPACPIRGIHIEELRRGLYYPAFVEWIERFDVIENYTGHAPDYNNPSELSEIVIPSSGTVVFDNTVNHWSWSSLHYLNYGFGTQVSFVGDHSAYCKLHYGIDTYLNYFDNSTVYYNLSKNSMIVSGSITQDSSLLSYSSAGLMSSITCTVHDPNVSIKNYDGTFNQATLSSELSMLYGTGSGIHVPGILIWVTSPIMSGDGEYDRKRWLLISPVQYKDSPDTEAEWALYRIINSNDLYSELNLPAEWFTYCETIQGDILNEYNITTLIQTYLASWITTRNEINISYLSVFNYNLVNAASEGDESYNVNNFTIVSGLNISELKIQQSTI